MSKKQLRLRSYIKTCPLYKVVVVDNNSDKENCEKLSSQVDNLIDILWLDDNLGGAGRFESRIRYVYDKYSPDWIWIMDADTYPDGDCVNR